MNLILNFTTLDFSFSSICHPLSVKEMKTIVDRATEIETFFGLFTISTRLVEFIKTSKELSCKNVVRHRSGIGRCKRHHSERFGDCEELRVDLLRSLHVNIDMRQRRIGE